MTTSNRRIGVVATAMGILLAVGTARAGSIDSPAAPTDAGSAMYTVTDIYNRLDTGASGAKRTGSFVEPSGTPGSTGKTLDEIMAKAPATNANAAVAAQVLSGKTYWGLLSGGWGTLTGTMPIQTLSAANDTVAAGYYAATTLSAVDADLVSGNIRSGVNIFGVAGAVNVVNTVTGDATATDLANGKKAWVDGAEVTGTAYPAPVAKTGETTGWATGGDGDLERGVAWPNPRFTDNGNGTVTDNLTGLIWLKSANFKTGRYWPNALTDCATLNSGEGGLTDGSVEGDWRLPNVQELQSLIDYGHGSPALPPGHPFTGVVSGNYWSSTTYNGDSSGAWFVNLIDGHVKSSPSNKVDFYNVWPVRGGQ